MTKRNSLKLFFAKKVRVFTVPCHTPCMSFLFLNHLELVGTLNCFLRVHREVHISTGIKKKNAAPNEGGQSPSKMCSVNRNNLNLQYAIKYLPKK